jgi:hypothetical protein
MKVKSTWQVMAHKWQSFFNGNGCQWKKLLNNVCGFLASIALRKKCTSLFSFQFENIIQHFISYMI